MSLPHVCECRICGTAFPLGSPLGVPAGGNILGLEILAPPKPLTCAHGYLICKPCKFPPVITEDANGDSN